MSKSDAFETAMLKFVFQNDNSGMTGATNWLSGTPAPGSTSLYVSLHNIDPTEGGIQSTGEITYTTYTRIGVTRNAGGWAVAGSTASNAGPVQFPICTSGSATATYFGIGTASTGAGNLMYSGILSSGQLNILSTPVQIQPVFATGALTITED